LWFLIPGGVWGEDAGGVREDSLILLSPAALSGLFGGVTTVAHLVLFCGVLVEGGVQICNEGGDGMGVDRVTAPETLVMTNHPFITPSLVTLASSIACSWILFRAPPNSSTTFVALITPPSTAVYRSPPGAVERRVGGGSGAAV